MTLAHGAGAGMHHSFMAALAASLAELALRPCVSNFPFMEPKKEDPILLLWRIKPFAAAITHAHENVFPSLPLFVAGKSFGGRLTSQY